MDTNSETGPNLGNESAELKPECQGATTTPAEQILGTCKGVLHAKVLHWMTEFPGHLADFNLETFEDLQNNTEMDVAATAAILFEDVNAMILTQGKNTENQKHCLSKMQAQTLAGIIKNTAKRCGGYTSPPRGDAPGGVLSSASGKKESQTSEGTEQGSTLPKSHLAPITPITQTQPPPPPKQAEPQQSPTKQRQQQNVQTKRALEQGALPQETGQQQQHLLYRPKRPTIVFDRGKLMSNSTLPWLQWFL